METDRKKAEDYFRKYVSDYDMGNVKIELKVNHTFRVAALAERIALSLKLDEEETGIAWLLGILHDVGRFEQIRRYDTFVDAVSVNHAALSADILFSDGLIRNFLQDASEDALLEKAIRMHNVYELPAALTERERMFCDILRDADKIDIFRVNCETPVDELYNTPIDKFYEDRITDTVKDDFMHERNVDRAHKRTAVDTLVGHISLVFGLVYPESIKIVKEQGYLEQMMAFESRNEDTGKDMQMLREIAEAFIINFDKD